MPGDDRKFPGSERGLEHGIEVGGQNVQAVTAATGRHGAAAVAAVVERDDAVVAGQIGDLVGPYSQGAGDAMREHDGIAVFGPPYLGVQPDAILGSDG